MRSLFSGILLSAITLFSCSAQKKAQTSDGWISLFDGKTTKGWHSYGKAAAGEAWKVTDGTLFLDAVANKNSYQSKGGGDLVTDESFGDFHLKYDWKISKNGNSGLIFWVQDDTAKYKEVWHTGPEMQILDNDGHADGKIVKHRAGNLYDLIAGTEGVVKPVGEWNHAEIISSKNKLEFILNGVTIVSTTYGDASWNALVAGSKFKTRPDFAKVPNGHFALQDHGNEVWFKNIMVKIL